MNGYGLKLNKTPRPHRRTQKEQEAIDMIQTFFLCQTPQVFIDPKEVYALCLYLLRIIAS